MIHFFGTRDHVGTLNQFADLWAPELRARIRTAAYETISFREPVHGGVCVFMDFERLLPLEMALARRLAAALRASPKNYTVLNDPARYLGRLRLLEVLHECGINEFRAFAAGALPGNLKFPVFVRSKIDHTGPATALLHSAAELKQALARPEFQNSRVRPHLMVAEFCDCVAADGIYRKYSVMNIGGTLVPRHMFFSHSWVTKHAHVVNAKTVAEEAGFIEHFPHAAQVAGVFRRAGVEYGRMDYGLRNGRVQVWEINTNPTIVDPPKKVDPLRRKLASASARRITTLLQTLAANHAGSPGFPFHSAKLLPAKLLQIFNRRRHRHRRK